MPELHDENDSVDQGRTLAGLGIMAKLEDFQYDM